MDNVFANRKKKIGKTKRVLTNVIVVKLLCSGLLFFLSLYISKKLFLRYELDVLKYAIGCLMCFFLINIFIRFIKKDLFFLMYLTLACGNIIALLMVNGCKILNTSLGFELILFFIYILIIGGFFVLVFLEEIFNKNFLPYFQTTCITIIVSIFFFHYFSVNFEAYLVLGVVIFFFIFFSFWVCKNIVFYFHYLCIAIGNLIIFFYVKHQEGFRIVRDLQDILYFSYASVLLLLFCIVGIANLFSKNKNKQKNYFIERANDLERLCNYLNRFEVVGLESLWGDGKTYLMKLFEQEYKVKFHFVFIGIMSVTCDSVESHIVNEINSILERNKILSIASRKLSALLKQPIFRGWDVFFVKEYSYSELFNAILTDVKKLDRPIILSFEDIDRIKNIEIIHKVFSIIEKLTESENIKVLFQYDEENLLSILDKDRKYIEKYIPYTMKLTPVPFENLITGILYKGKSEKSKHFEFLNEKDFDFLGHPVHYTCYLIKHFKIDDTIQLKVYPQIRKVLLFLREVNMYIHKLGKSEQEKRIVITFFLVKHFMYDLYTSMNIADSFIDICKFTYNEKNYNILQLNNLYESNNKDNSLYQNEKKIDYNLVFRNIDNKNRLAVLSFFDFNFKDLLPAFDMSFLQDLDSLEKIEVLEKNKKIDSLIWHLLASGKNEYTDLENIVSEIKNKVLDELLEDKVDIFNRLIKDISISTLFQGFRIYSDESESWLKLLAFYSKFSDQKSIDEEFIKMMNAINITNKKVFFEALTIFNSLEVKTNINSSNAYVKFVKYYFETIFNFGYAKDVKKLSNLNDYNLATMLNFPVNNVSVLSWENTVPSGEIELFKEVTASLVSMSGSSDVQTEQQSEIKAILDFVEKNNKLVHFT